MPLSIRTKTVRRRGFTLVELLVVVSIIALLVAILLPSMTKSRKQAKGLLCLTRLRQLSHGWHMYADENQDVCLPGRYAKEDGGAANPANWYDVGNGLKYRPRWLATMGAQVGLYAFSMPSTSNDRQEYDAEVYHCPAVPEWTDERNAAFGYNHQFLGNARKTNGKFHNFPVIRSRIRSFAGTVLGGDCMGTAAGLPKGQRERYENDGTSFASLGNHGWTLDPPRLTETSDRGTGDPGTPRTAVDPRHLGEANVVFCDGHGERASALRLGYRQRENERFADADSDPDQPTNNLFTGTGRDLDPPALPQ